MAEVEPMDAMDAMDANENGDTHPSSPEQNAPESASGAELSLFAPDLTPMTSTTSTTAATTEENAGLTPRQQAQRGLVVCLAVVVCVALVAPLALALVVALASLVTDALAALMIVRLFAHGAFMQTSDPLNALNIASRTGALAISYLGLFFALMTLLAGLLGRGQGRLFIIPGALLTASALVLFGGSLALCWSLLLALVALLAAPPAVPLAAALYLALDTVALATILADTRQTRRRWLPRRHPRAASATDATTTQRDAPPTTPPTLAGA